MQVDRVLTTVIELFCDLIPVGCEAYKLLKTIINPLHILHKTKIIFKFIYAVKYWIVGVILLYLFLVNLL